MKLVQILRIDKHIDAHFVKSKLESEGIDCFLLGENMTSLEPISFISSKIDYGIKINVKETEVEKAMEVIKSLDVSFLNQEQVFCPNCKSENIEKKGKSALSLAAVSSFFLGKSSYRCKDCGTEFKA